MPSASFDCLGVVVCLWSMDGFLSLLFGVLPPLFPPPRPLVAASFGLRFVEVEEDNSVTSSSSSSCGILLSKYKLAVA